MPQLKEYKKEEENIFSSSFWQRKPKRVIPGFSLTLGYSVLYLGLIVLLPLCALFLKTAEMSFDQFLQIIFAPRAVASYWLTFGLSFLAGLVNIFFGFLLAWSIVRYSFPGRRLVDALIDLPFALPTAVAGIALTAIYAKNGWIGQFLEPFGIKIAFTPIGIFIALIFIGLPFVVRTVQPVLEDLNVEYEEAAASLGANRLQIILRVVMPPLIPVLLTGFALAFARGIGEYGSVIFIAGNIPLISEISPLLIVTKLEQYDYMGATAIATFMLIVSFLLLLLINLLQAWASRFRKGNS